MFYTCSIPSVSTTTGALYSTPYNANLGTWLKYQRQLKKDLETGTITTSTGSYNKSNRMTQQMERVTLLQQLVDEGTL